MDERRSVVIIGLIVVIVGLVASWAFISSGQRAGSTLLNEVSDAAAIQNGAQLSHLSIATSENFARQKIYVISAHLKNVSDKPLRMAEVRMVFTDFDGKSIHEYSQKVLNPNQQSLAPGDDLRFEVRQENLPRGWNYRVPITEITKLGY